MRGTITTTTVRVAICNFCQIIIKFNCMKLKLFLWANTFKGKSFSPVKRVEKWSNGHSSLHMPPHSSSSLYWKVSPCFLESDKCLLLCLPPVISGLVDHWLSTEISLLRLLVTHSLLDAWLLVNWGAKRRRKAFFCCCFFSTRIITRLTWWCNQWNPKRTLPHCSHSKIY